MAGGRPRGPPEEVLPTAQKPGKRIRACEPEQKRYPPATRYQMTRKGMEGRRAETAGSYLTAVQGAYAPLSRMRTSPTARLAIRGTGAGPAHGRTKGRLWPAVPHYFPSGRAMHFLFLSRGFFLFIRGERKALLHAFKYQPASILLSALAATYGQLRRTGGECYDNG